MVDSKISLLPTGIVIVFGLVLNGAGVFTPAWIVASASYGNDTYRVSIGIVPYYTENPGWFNAASILMFTSFALYILMALNFSMVCYRVHQSGYSRRIRKYIYSLALTAVFIIGNTITAVILIGVNASTFNNIIQTYTLNYSTWLCVASAAILCSALKLLSEIEIGCR